MRCRPTGTTAIEDVVRGHVEWENALQGDHVIFRSDGTPTYLFANPFDDIAMGITHVIRGEDLLPSTPTAARRLRRLSDAVPPTYAHLPMVLGTDKKKLSKRHGAVSVEEFRDRGVLPQALVNYLALVGLELRRPHDVHDASPELVERFSLERVNSSPGVFDPEKLEWLNGEHLRALPPAEFTAALQRYLEVSGSALAEQPERVAEVAPIVQEKLRTLGQFEGFAGFLFGPAAPDPAAWARVEADAAAARFARRRARGARRRRDVGRRGDPRCARRRVREGGHEAARALHAVRVALTGKTVAPGLYESLELLGRDESLARIDAAPDRLAG